VLLARTVDSTKDILSGKSRKEMEDGSIDHYLLQSVAIGALAYMAYVTCVGGDFMSGRFLALPYFVTIWLIYASIPVLETKRALICVGFLIGLKGLSVSMASDSMARCMSNIENPFPAWGQSFCVKSGIADERAFYSPTRIWFYPEDGFDSHRIVKDRSYWLATEALKSPEKTYIFGAIGALGYYAPRVRFLDFHALTDPLLARLPIKNVHEWRIGHFERDIPDGYIFALEHNRLDQMHPSLAAYYKPLRLIVTGDLLDPERLKAIVEFNLGRYDHFKEDYLRAQGAITD
jgi:arabinofuranosyltransferase